jgi:cytoskeletal protein RodZ
MGDTNENQEVSNSMKKGGNKGLIIGAAVVIVILVAVIILLIIRPWDKAEAQPADADGNGSQREVITEENAEEEVSDFFKGIPEGIPTSYTVTQNSTWEFPDGKSESTNAYVENDANNATPVYFDVVVDATGETVYSSPVLELGAKLDKIKLDKELAKGEYECTLTYHLVDGEQNTLTTVNVGVTLSVKK